MSTIEIIPVDGRRDQKRFMQFAWDHYRGDENWIPPLRMDQKELLNYKHHPFYECAEIQTFLAVADGAVAGRIAAIVDHGHNRTHKEKRGMFGFFECVDDPEVSRRLFEATRSWHADRGLDCQRGPLNPAMNHECGLLVEGFEYPPTFKTTYNKPYYEKLIVDSGFEKSQDLYSFWGNLDMLHTLDPKLQFVIDEARRRFNITVRCLDRKNFDRDVRSFLEIYNQALPGTWGFVPFTDAELKHVAGGLKHLIIPEMTTIAEVDGKPIGAVFGLLDYNPIIKQIDGRLFPFGFLKILFGRKNLKKIRLVSTNVVPEFQMWGVGLILVERLVEDGLAGG